ncbi:hypothetical protein CYMTET_12581, partial [Cymbomonas tetramitiformis]
MVSWIEEWLEQVSNLAAVDEKQGTGEILWRTIDNALLRKDAVEDVKQSKVALNLANILTNTSSIYIRRLVVMSLLSVVKAEAVGDLQVDLIQTLVPLYCNLKDSKRVRAILGEIVGILLNQCNEETGGLPLSALRLGDLEGLALSIIQILSSSSPDGQFQALQLLLSAVRLSGFPAVFVQAGGIHCTIHCGVGESLVEAAMSLRSLRRLLEVAPAKVGVGKMLLTNHVTREGLFKIASIVEESATASASLSKEENEWLMESALLWGTLCASNAICQDLIRRELEPCDPASCAALAQALSQLLHKVRRANQGGAARGIDMYINGLIGGVEAVFKGNKRFPNSGAAGSLPSSATPQAVTP